MMESAKQNNCDALIDQFLTLLGSAGEPANAQVAEYAAILFRRVLKHERGGKEGIPFRHLLVRGAPAVRRACFLELLVAQARRAVEVFVAHDFVDGAAEVVPAFRVLVDDGLGGRLFGFLLTMDSAAVRVGRALSRESAVQTFAISCSNLHRSRFMFMWIW